MDPAGGGGFPAGGPFGAFTTPGMGGGWGDGFGWGAPYVPVTPLGGLWGLKGDLLLPIIGVGFAIFILILIILAVKYALNWKMDALSDLSGVGHRYGRSTVDPVQQNTVQDPDYINQLSAIILPAIVSKGCNDRLMCELGSMARERQELPALFKFLEDTVPNYLHDPMAILRTSAEKPIECAKVYPCPDAHEDEQSNEIVKNPASPSAPTQQVDPNMQGDQAQQQQQQQQATSPKFLQGLQGGKPKK